MYIPHDEMSYHAKIIPPHTKNSIFDIIEKCSLNEEEEFKLFDYIKSKNRIVISTPFSRAAVDRLVKYDIPADKIGSGECNTIYYRVSRNLKAYYFEYWNEFN